MARRDTPVFVCDAAGCRSTCTLSPASSVETLTDQLTSRGWLVQPPRSGRAGSVERHFCPGCKTQIESPEEGS